MSNESKATYGNIVSGSWTLSIDSQYTRTIIENGILNLFWVLAGISQKIIFLLFLSIYFD